MPRLDKEKQKRLEPQRMAFAIKKLSELNIKTNQVSEHELQFIHKNETVHLFPFSGWHSGKSIVDGRGIYKLLNQLKK